MAIEVVSAFLIDGNGHPKLNSEFVYPLQLPLGGDITNHFRQAINFGDVGHWKSLIFDPQLASLFQSPPQVPAIGPTASKLGGQFASWKAALIAIAIVAVLVAILAVLWTRKRNANEAEAFKQTERVTPVATHQPIETSRSITQTSSSLPGAVNSFQEVKSSLESKPSAQWSKGVTSRE